MIPAQGRTAGVQRAASCRDSRRHGLLRLLAGLALVCCVPVVADSVQIITSPDRNPAQLDRGLLRALFTARVGVWPDGRPAHVFVLPDDQPVHELFCREQLNTYPYVLREIWDRRISTGTGLVPEQVHSEDEMRLKVRTTPGAIGYISGTTSANEAPPPKK